MKKLIFLLCSILFMGTSFGYYSCADQYGFGATENLQGNCVCRDGYMRGKDWMGKTKCIEGITLCRNKYGLNTKYNRDTGRCQCIDGYYRNTDTFGSRKCESLQIKCMGIPNTEYDLFNNTCNCKEGYTFKKDNFGNGKCEKKQWNVYFFLKELKDDEALLYSSYERQSYKIELGLCSFLEDYLGDNVVINLGTDKIFNYGDYLVQQNHDRTCRIWDIEEVDDDYTLYSCENIYGEGSEEYGEDSCVCKKGYKWNYNQDQCIIDISYTSTNLYKQADREIARDNLGATSKVIEDLVRTAEAKGLENDLIKIAKTFSMSPEPNRRNMGIYILHLLNK